jgi:hypothetical protein
MKRYNTETERIANEAFDKVMNETTLPHAKFYVNGVEWRPGDPPRIASAQEQEDFWSHIPRERQGVRERPSVAEGVMVYLGVAAVMVATAALLWMGFMGLWKAVGR